MATQHPKENEKVSVEDGFIGFRKKGSSYDFIVPKSGMNNIFFECIPRDDSSYIHTQSGCSAYTTYRGMYVRYLFRRSQLAQWQEIQKQAFGFIDSIITDIEE